MVKVLKQTKHAVKAWRNRESATCKKKPFLNPRYVPFPSLFRNALSLALDTPSRYPESLPCEQVAMHHKPDLCARICWFNARPNAAIARLDVTARRLPKAVTST